MPQPDGPISETNSPGLEVELDVLESDRAALAERLGDVADRDGGGGHATFSGARRTTSLSAIATMQKKAIPSAAAMMFVAQSAEGSSE